MLIFIIGLIVWGFVVGGLARLALPGPDPMPWYATIGLGLGGSLIGGIIARILLGTAGGLIELAANPYAAMPSLHAADALIVGIILSSVVRNRVGKALWLIWPLWVSFAVMATGNHFWLDVLAGIVLGTLCLAAVYHATLRRFIASLL